jgi:hypothetical protein
VPPRGRATTGLVIGGLETFSVRRIRGDTRAEAGLGCLHPPCTGKKRRAFTVRAAQLSTGMRVQTHLRPGGHRGTSVFWIKLASSQWTTTFSNTSSLLARSWNERIASSSPKSQLINCWAWSRVKTVLLQTASTTTVAGQCTTPIKGCGLVRWQLLPVTRDPSGIAAPCRRVPACDQRLLSPRGHGLHQALLNFRSSWTPWDSWTW